MFVDGVGFGSSSFTHYLSWTEAGAATVCASTVPHTLGEARVPPDHLPRRLRAVVDLRFVRGLGACYDSRTGQPSIDQLGLFKMLLGYFYGLISERGLVLSCRSKRIYV
jgi:hypothetical protein